MDRVRAQQGRGVRAVDKAGVLELQIGLVVLGLWIGLGCWGRAQ